MMPILKCNREETKKWSKTWSGMRDPTALWVMKQALLSAVGLHLVNPD